MHLLLTLSTFGFQWVRKDRRGKKPWASLLSLFFCIISFSWVVVITGKEHDKKEYDGGKRNRIGFLGCLCLVHNCLPSFSMQWCSGSNGECDCSGISGPHWLTEATHLCTLVLSPSPPTHTLGSAWTLCHRASWTIYENGAGRDGGHANWASLLCSPTYITYKTQVRDKMIKNLKTVTAKHYGKQGRSWAQGPGNCLGHRPRKLVPSIGEKTLWQAISWLQAGRRSMANRPTWLAWGKPEGQPPTALGHNESQLQSSFSGSSKRPRY